MSKVEKKPRTEWIYGTTAEEVTEIGLELSADGSNVHFTQDMTNIRVQSSYPREKKDPKILNETPADNPNIPFSPNKALEGFDRLVAVDTNTRLIRGEQVSVTGIAEGEWNWEAGEDGLRRAIRPQARFCLEFLGVKNDQEQLGWAVAITELIKEPRYHQPDRIGLIVDCGYDKLDAYNSRRQPLFVNRYLPPNFTLLYATSDAGSECGANFLIKAADSVARQVLQLLEKGSIPWNKNGISTAGEDTIFAAYRKIPVRTHGVPKSRH